MHLSQKLQNYFTLRNSKLLFLYLDRLITLIYSYALTSRPNRNTFLAKRRNFTEIIFPLHLQCVLTT